MLYTTYLLSVGANKVLSNTILATIIVNPSSIRGKGIIIDKMLEIYNIYFSLDIKMRSNSTYNLEASIESITINRKLAAVLREIFKRNFGTLGTMYYTDKKIIDDIFVYSNKIRANSRITR